MKQLAFLFFILCSSCTSALESAAPNNALTLKNLMTGVWATDPDDPNNSFIDTRIALESLGDGEWVYLQLQTGPEKKLYRQRVLQLLNIETGVVQKAWSFAEPEKFADVPSDITILKTISLDDLEATLADGCDSKWRPSTIDGDFLWTGYVDPNSCKIFSERRQVTIGIEGETRLQKNRLRQTERGFDSDGNRLFGTEPGEFIELSRVDPSSER